MFILKYVGVRSGINCIKTGMPARNYAARKGYREMAKKKKVKVEVKKTEFIPHNKRNLLKSKPTVSRRIDDNWKPMAIDNVYVTKFFRGKVYTFSEALQCHRETHHPTVYNDPRAPLNVTIELDMHAEKKNKFVDKFSRMVAVPHPYNHGEERRIVAFCKTPELQDIAISAGAMLAGGSELIKSIQIGELSVHDYNYFVAHTDILPEIISLRGLMKKNFPSLRNGTVVDDIEKTVKKYSTGLFYTAQRDEFEEDYGWIDACIGTLDMHGEQLESNLRVLLQDVQSVKPKRENPFVTKCTLLSPPSVESLNIDYDFYLSENVSKENLKAKEDAGDESSDSDEEASRVPASVKAR